MPTYLLVPKLLLAVARANLHRAWNAALLRGGHRMTTSVTRSVSCGCAVTKSTIKCECGRTFLEDTRVQLPGYGP